jgi:hypothetical protein
MDEGRIKEFRRVCLATPQIRFAYLFGAGINGRCTTLSGFGLAVYLGRRSPFVGRLRLMQRLARTLGSHDFDLVILDDAPLSTNRAIVHGGRVIKEEETLRATFEARLAKVTERLKGVPSLTPAVVRRESREVEGPVSGLADTP